MTGSKTSARVYKEKENDKKVQQLTNMQSCSTQKESERYIRKRERKIKKKIERTREREAGGGAENKGIHFNGRSARYTHQYTEKGRKTRNNWKILQKSTK